MKNLSALKNGLKFAACKSRRNSAKSYIRKKKSFIADTICDAGEGPSSSQFNVADVENWLKGIKDEIASFLLKKRETDKKIVELRAEIKLVTRSIKDLWIKQHKTDESLKGFKSIKDEFDVFRNSVNDEQTLDSEIKELEERIAVLQESADSIVEKRKIVESEKEELTNTKGNLAQEVGSIVHSIALSQRTAYELRVVKKDQNLKIDTVRDLSEKCIDAQDELNQLNSGGDEFEPQITTLRQYVDDTTTKIENLNKLIVENRREKKELEDEIYELLVKRKKINKLKERLNNFAKEKNELEERLLNLDQLVK